MTRKRSHRWWTICIHVNCLESRKLSTRRKNQKRTRCGKRDSPTLRTSTQIRRSTTRRQKISDSKMRQMWGRRKQPLTTESGTYSRNWATHQGWIKRRSKEWQQKMKPWWNYVNSSWRRTRSKKSIWTKLISHIEALTKILAPGGTRAPPKEE